MRLAYLDDLSVSLDIAATYDEIRAVQSEVKAAGKPPALQQAPDKKKTKGRGRPAEAKLPQPLRLQTPSGVQVLVGRTASQNDTATFAWRDRKTSGSIHEMRPALMLSSGPIPTYLKRI